MSTRIAAVSAACSLIASTAALAATKTATVTVAARIAGSCSVSAVSAIDFGNIDIATALTTLAVGSATAQVNCPTTQAYDLLITASAGATTPITGSQNLTLSGGSATIPFSIGFDSTSFAKSKTAQTGSGANQNHTIFAKLTGTTAPQTGTYLNNSLFLVVRY